jgi:hypothetical protein
MDTASESPVAGSSSPRAGEARKANLPRDGLCACKTRAISNVNRWPTFTWAACRGFGTHIGFALFRDGKHLAFKGNFLHEILIRNS